VRKGSARLQNHSCKRLGISLYNTTSIDLCDAVAKCKCMNTRERFNMVNHEVKRGSHTLKVVD
jgi:hypothetical protein